MTYIPDNVDEFLEHHGIKGMKWGVRSNGVAGVSGRTNRDARKDAQEFVRAKLFYGEGAGTRRKLIKARVEGKSSKNPAYKKAFDEHVSRQDTSKHASKASSERTRKDTVKKNKQRAGALARRFTGEQGTQAAFVAATLAGGAFLASSKGQAVMRQAYNKANKSAPSKAAAQFILKRFS